MGQAKNRGSREQRVADALGLQKISITELKKVYGLAEDAEFLGYAVHMLDSDEFLVGLTDDGYRTRKAWAKTPERAKTYRRLDLAYEDSRKCEGSIVVGMFDIGTQIFVATITNNNS